MKKISSIGTNTQVCAIIGNPVAHSLSPAIHNAAFSELNLDFVYVAFRVENVKHTLLGMRAMDNFRGMSVTIPHKIEAMKYLDEIPDIDRHIGSINTIIREGDRLVGLGTDGPGALKALVDAGVEIIGKNVLMLGSGGAARAIAFTIALDAGPAQIALLDMDKVMLQQLTSDLKAGTDVPIKSHKLTPKSLTATTEKADIIINCTPIGMHPREDATLIPAELLRPDQVVFDIVYNPLETKFCAEAKARGLKVIPGVDMFINQAVLQFERFTGVDAPLQVMRRMVMERLSS